MRQKMRDNSLSLVIFGLFILFLLGHSMAGYYAYNTNQHEHQQPPIRYAAYLVSSHFWATVFENWESEFLQMAMFVLLTVCLRQKGSPESKSLEGEEEVDQDPNEKRDDPRAPWPVRKGGAVLWLYSHSLSLAFAVLFFVSFAVHA